MMKYTRLQRLYECLVVPIDILSTPCLLGTSSKKDISSSRHLFSSLGGARHQAHVASSLNDAGGEWRVIDTWMIADYLLYVGTRTKRVHGFSDFHDCS